MPVSTPRLPQIPESERTPLVDALLQIIVAQQEQIARQQEEIQALKDGIARLKGHEKTCFASLHAALKRLHKIKAERLLVLERQDLPLHNNLIDNDIRGYVLRRKRSGSTRSDPGRLCRDSFASLKKTCRKLGISFWRYLLDRCSGSNTVPYRPELVRERAQAARA